MATYYKDNMLSKHMLYATGLLLLAFVSIHVTIADTQDNKVDEIPEYYMVQGVKVYPGDRECVLVGGMCVHSSDCYEPTTNHGLCPTNAHRGIECCYELASRPAPCEQHMGECMDRCHRTLMRPSTDCTNGQICCVLIK